MKTFKKIIKYFLYFSAFIITCAILAHCTFKRYSATSYNEAKKCIPFDVVIVPGAPYQVGAADVNSAMESVYKARILWAKHLYDSGFTRNIIFSGSAVHTPYIESRTMKLYAIALGVPESKIYTEEMAEHSSENIYFSWKLARQLGFKKIALATDTYQSGMLRSVINKYTPGVMSLPIQFDKISPNQKTLPSIDASTAKVDPFVSLGQRQGFWERFYGTMGKRIRDDANKHQK